MNYLEAAQKQIETIWTTGLKIAEDGNMESSKNLDIAMNFIGWGDPHKSVWFFGLEEGAKFNQEYIN